MVSRTLIRLLCLGALVVPAMAPAEPPPFLSFQQDIPLDGGESRFGGQVLDSASNTLYVAHTGAGQILLVNLTINKVSNTLSGFPGVSGLFLIPELHRLYAGVSRYHQVEVLDTRSLKVLAKIPVGNFPSDMAYVPELHDLYVSDDVGGILTIIDVDTNKRVASINLGGKVGGVRYDPAVHQILVSVPVKNELDTVDPWSRTILQKHRLSGAKKPGRFWLSVSNRLALVGCRGDSKLLVVDLTNFQETGIASVGQEPDGVAFDDNLGYLYVASESGTVSLFRLRSHQLEKIGDFTIGDHSHSVAVDPQTHLVYFPLEKTEHGPLLRVMKPQS